MDETQQVPNLNPISSAPPLTTYPMTQSTPTSKTPWIFISLIIILIGIASYFGYQNYQLKQQIDTQQPTASSESVVASPIVVATPTSIIDPTANWETYKDSKNGFSIKYPSSWRVLPGGGVNPWIDISSPDIGAKGSQDAHIGMNVNITVFNTVKQLQDNDLKQLVSDEGILKHMKVNVVTEGFVTIQNHRIYKYEYEGNEQSYMFHYWGMNVANDNNIISILLTDFKEDKSLNTEEISKQILSTFKFTN